MKKKMMAMLLGLALAASTLGGCGEATVEETTEVVETEVEEETEEVVEAENGETEEVTKEAEAEAEDTEEASDETEAETTEEDSGESEAETTEEVSGESEAETTEEVSDESEAEVETTEEVTEEVTDETTEAEVVYTYSEVTAMMYAKQSVNVRDLPSTSGNRVGGLSTNQEVSVTGQCNENGWYRISYNGADAYVSNNYLVSEKAETQMATTTTTQDAATTTQTETQQTTETTSTATQVSDSTSATTQDTTSYILPQYFDNYADAYDAAVYWQTVMNVKVIIDASRTDGLYAVLDYNTVMGASTTASGVSTSISSYSSTECVGYINDLRASLGLSSLTWSDSLAEVALARAKELAEADALDNHAGLSKYGSYGENIASGMNLTAYGAYTGWYNSEGHYNNMVNSGYTYVAVAYAFNGNTGYWVTIFQ